MAPRLGATKEINYSSLNPDVIAFVLFPEALELSKNFNISEMVYSQHPDPRCFPQFSIISMSVKCRLLTP